MRDPVASLRFCAYVLLNFSRLFVSVIPTVRSRGVVLPIDSFSRESRAGPENGPFLHKVMIENLQMRASMATMEGNIRAHSRTRKRPNRHQSSLP